jgi:DNA-3-methyladenine glycosylase I
MRNREDQGVAPTGHRASTEHLELPDDQGLRRCPWCEGDTLYTTYHDTEWGRPERDDRKLFEYLILDGAQAGLSWITILRRREGYHAAFHGMNPEKIARYGDKDITRLMADARIIRNRRKITSAIENARAWLEMRDSPLTFSAFLWDRVDGKPIINRFSTMAEIPAYTPLSEGISKDLKQRGFTFVGPTIIYAILQAAGLVNDHLTTCYLHPDNDSK